MSDELSLKINEIFYSIQGEGGRTGEASIFIRLAGCNMSCDFCDTDYAVRREMRLPDILATINKYPCRWIVWTGGEPCLQLTTEIVDWFHIHGVYMQAIETNGSLPLPDGLDYIACSPKVDPKKLWENFPISNLPHEFRFPITNLSNIPKIGYLPKAKNYYLSPIFVGVNQKEANELNIRKALTIIKSDPRWKLSIQLHKLINIK